MWFSGGIVHHLSVIGQLYVTANRNQIDHNNYCNSDEKYIRPQQVLMNIHVTEVTRL